MRMAAPAAVMLSCLASAPGAASNDTPDERVARGKYLVRITGCGDCHTPGYFHGRPDATRYLGGSDVGLEMPGLGTFVGPNLTPDRDTGLGRWSTQQIVLALTRGVRPDGRVLAPIMPWAAYSQLSAEDAAAIAAYLQSLRPVRHQVPGPFAQGEVVSTFVLRLIPPPDGATARK